MRTFNKNFFSKKDRVFQKISYIGCINNSSINLNYSTSISMQSMTNEWCLDYCSHLNYDIFSTQNKNVCTCGFGFRIVNAIDSCECNQTCQGSSQQACGGLLASSVYQILCELIKN